MKKLLYVASPKTPPVVTKTSSVSPTFILTKACIYRGLRLAGVSPWLDWDTLGLRAVPPFLNSTVVVMLSFKVVPKKLKRYRPDDGAVNADIPLNPDPTFTYETGKVMALVADVDELGDATEKHGLPWRLTLLYPEPRRTRLGFTLTVVISTLRAYQVTREIIISI